MRRSVVLVAMTPLLAVTGLWRLSPAYSVGDVEDRTARMTGGGWVAVGDLENSPGPDARAHVEVRLPCPGGDVGFNPQPDPPGHLRVRSGATRFRLTDLDTSHCSLGGPDTLEGSGRGICNDEPATVSFRFTDGGGRSGAGARHEHGDSLRVDVQGAAPACTLVFDGPLGGGNLQVVGGPAGR